MKSVIKDVCAYSKVGMRLFRGGLFTGGISRKKGIKKTKSPKLFIL